jgi:hypothetical protein
MVAINENPDMNEKSGDDDMMKRYEERSTLLTLGFKELMLASLAWGKTGGLLENLLR